MLSKKTLSLKSFSNKYGFNDETMKENDLTRKLKIKISNGSEITTKRGFVNIDNGSMGATHWTCFYMKDNKSFYVDSIGVYLDNFILEKLPKPIPFHFLKFENVSSNLCGVSCL